MKIVDLKARDIREKIVSKELTALEVVEAFLEHIENTDKDINAFISIDKEGAKEAALRIDDKIKKGEKVGRLAGIPIGIKDNIVTRDLRTTCGSKMLENYQSPYDARVVEIIRKEDGIIIGKTNMDEFSMGTSTETSYFGPSKNPLDKDLVPGGSSGGSAAALASKQVALALGSDTGGSVRQAASFCGLVGLRPSYGRISRYGLVTLSNTMDQIGVLARDIEDAGLFLSVLAGYDENDPTSVDLDIAPNLDFKADGIADIKAMKIGVPSELESLGIDKEVMEAFNKAIETIKDQGGHVEEISLPHLEYALETYLLISNAEASSNLARFDGLRYGYRAEDYETLDELYVKSRTEGFGDEVKRRITLGTYILTKSHAEEYYKKALKIRTLIREDFDKAFEGVDVLLLPTSTCQPFKLGERLPNPVDMYKMEEATIPASLAGLPAMSIPINHKASLPTGLQVIGKKFREEDVLKLGLAIERMVE